ncbi:hypothetical protein EMIT0111MI5_100062 [Burkholderia sp. IT-111MI5]
MAKGWAMPCGKSFAARGGRCDHSTTDVRGAQGLHVDSKPGTGWERQPDQRSAERERWPIVTHGTAQAPERRLESTGDPCVDHQSSDDL